MATLQYTVFEGAGEVALGDPIQEGVVTITGTAAASAAISGSDRIRRRVRVAVDANCWVAWGAAAVALNDGTNGRMMGTDVSTVEYFDVECGHIISVIQRA